MELVCTDLGKRYNAHWIFKNFNARFESGARVGIVGGNGSGKSTLLKCLMAYERYTEGLISYGSQKHTADEVFQLISLCAPYQQLYEELSLKECFDLHVRFRATYASSFKDFEEALQLQNALNKPLKQFSSGMKQRVKLALAIMTKSEFVFLDEPLSNLDHQATQWFHSLLEAFIMKRSLFIASNRNPDELKPTQSQLDITQWHT